MIEIIIDNPHIPEEYQNQVDNILKKTTLQEIAEGLCGIIERMHYELPGREFWQAASGIAYSVPNEATCEAMRREMSRALTQDAENLPDRVRFLYQTIE